MQPLRTMQYRIIASAVNRRDITQILEQTPIPVNKKAAKRLLGVSFEDWNEDANLNLNTHIQEFAERQEV